MSMTDPGGSAEGSASGPDGGSGASTGGAVAMSESWSGSYPAYASSFGDDVSGNQEHWSGRMPPQDSDAEQSVLGSMLISKDAIADVNEQIGGPDFYRPAHETIYHAL